MTTPSVDVAAKSVTFEGTTYSIQALGEDSFTVLDKGVPVGRIMMIFGAPNGVTEGDALNEDQIYAIAEAWFNASPAALAAGTLSVAPRAPPRPS
jgi:hypothetical protein